MGKWGRIFLSSALVLSCIQSNVSFALAKQTENLQENTYDKEYAPNFYKLMLAEVALSRKQRHQALGLYLDVLNAYPDHLIYEKTFRVALMLKAHDVASKLIDHWLAHHPGHAVPNIQKARYYISQGEYRTARQQLDQISSDKMGNVYHETVFLQALIALELREYPGALELLSTLKGTRFDAESTYFTAQAYEVMGQTQDAEEWYNSVPKGQYYIQSQLRLSTLYAGQKQYQKALDILRDLDAKESGDQISKTLLESNILASMNKGDEAIHTLSQQLEQTPDDFNLLFLRGVIYADLGQPDRAEKDLSFVLKHNQESAEVLNALGYTLTNYTNRYTEAYSLLSKALKINPESPAIIDSYGWVLFKMGEYEKASEYLAKAYKLYPESEIGVHYAVALYAMGQVNQARNLVHKMLLKEKLSKNSMRILQQYHLQPLTVTNHK